MLYLVRMRQGGENRCSRCLMMIRSPSRWPVTCSAGITQSDGNTADELMRRTDAALYNAKNAGRNRAIAA